MKARSIAIGASCLVLLSASLFQMGEVALYAIGDFLVVKDTLGTADVIHVIAGLASIMITPCGCIKRNMGK